LSGEIEAERSRDIQSRVEKARTKQNERFSGMKIYSNGEMAVRDIKKFCILDNESKKLLMAAMQKLNLSARSYFRIIKVARTIADLDSKDEILVQHISEALQYRPKNID
jgi:magnesium chelatase family protein